MSRFLWLSEMTTHDNLKALFQRTHDDWTDLCARENAGERVTAKRIRARDKLITIGLFLAADMREKQ